MSNFVSNDNATSLFTKLKQRLALRPKTFTGTTAQWEALTSAQKEEYEIVNITDDYTPGGGGGHTIEDAEGTELTQRHILKVGGSLIAEDDDTNEKTIITDGQIEIDYDDWMALTDEEREAIPKAIITNAPDGIRVRESVSVTGDGSKTNATLLNELFALIDVNKISEHSMLRSVNSTYSLSAISSTFYEFQNTSVGSSDWYINYFEIKSSNSKRYQVTNGTINDMSSTVVTNGQKFTIYY